MSRASIKHDTPEGFWEFAKLKIPLVCFGALKHAQDGNPSRARYLRTICEELIDAGLFKDIPEQILREIEWQIASLKGTQFKKLIDATSPTSHAGQETRVLNGCVKAAADLCYDTDPGLNAPFRDRLLAHARTRHGVKWYEDLSALVSDPSQTAEQREAALFLAGECSDTRLAVAVTECWHVMQEQGDKLSRGMLFAAVSCLSGIDDKTLDSVFRAWGALPSQDPEGQDSSGLSDERYWVAHDCLSRGLPRVKSERTLRPLIQLARSNTDMRYVIYDCLERVDHPLAATFVACYIAHIDKLCEGKDGRFNTLASSRFGFFGLGVDRNVRYSNPALLALQAVWEDTNNEHFFRKRCFQLWRPFVGLKRLRRLAVNPPQGLEEEVLFTRCSLGDVTAVTELRGKIEEGTSRGVYWFQLICRYDSRLFEDLILQKLEQNEGARKTNDKPDYGADCTIADILVDRRDEFAEGIIVKNWESLRNIENYSRVLLCIARPSTLSLHANHFKKIEDKEKYFEHLSYAYGFRNPDRPGITDVTQLEALEPYLDHFNSRLIEDLWEECNEKGFEVWRAEHLDSRLSKDGWAFKQINDEAAFRQLDVELASQSSPAMAAYLWSRIRRSNSVPPRALIDKAKRYVESRSNAESLEFLAELLALIGHRSDLDYLQKQVDVGLLSQRKLEGTAFAIRKRSLI